MYPCPSYKQCTVSLLAKILSCPPVPFRCKTCGALGFCPQAPGGSVLVTNAIVLTLAGFASIAFHSGVPLALGAVLSGAVWLLRIHFARINTITAEEAARVRVATGASVILVLLSSLVQ
jgi:hypothetical protein